MTKPPKKDNQSNGKSISPPGFVANVHVHQTGRVDFIPLAEGTALGMPFAVGLDEDTNNTLIKFQTPVGQFYFRVDGASLAYACASYITGGAKIQ